MSRGIKPTIFVWNSQVGYFFVSSYHSMVEIAAYKRLSMAKKSQMSPKSDVFKLLSV